MLSVLLMWGCIESYLLYVSKISFKISLPKVIFPSELWILLLDDSFHSFMIFKLFVRFVHKDEIWQITQLLYFSFPFKSRGIYPVCNTIWTSYTVGNRYSLPTYRFIQRYWVTYDNQFYHFTTVLLFSMHNLLNFKICVFCSLQFIHCKMAGVCRYFLSEPCISSTIIDCCIVDLNIKSKITLW